MLSLDLTQDTLIWAFNTRWDHFRVLTRPVVGHSSVLLCPEPSPPWLVPEKALWGECDPNGTLLRLLSIKTHVDGGTITGFTFTYESDLVRKFGFTEGDNYKKLVFRKQERLVLLEVRSYSSAIHGITVSSCPAPNTAPTSLGIDSLKLETAMAKTGQAVALRSVLNVPKIYLSTTFTFLKWWHHKMVCPILQRSDW